MEAPRLRRSVVALGVLALASSVVAAACGGDDASADDASPSGASGANGDASTPTDDASSTADGGGTTGDGGGTPSSCGPKPGASGDRTVKITSGGVERSFDLHVPATLDRAKPAPLVLVFHGYTMSPAAIASASRFSAQADARGMIVAYPAGTNGGFNAGECCGSAATSKVDDVGFARDMIAKISADHCIDPKRVYSTGFSNGGFLSYRFACEMSDVFAAVASVSGTLGIPPDTCKPKRPVPLLHIHGTGDLVVPYNGGGVGNNRSVAISTDTFKTSNGCPSNGAVVYTKDDVSCTKWSPCTASADVELCTITNGGHQWPGGDALPYGGAPTKNLDASKTIADWFDAHPMP